MSWWKERVEYLFAWGRLFVSIVASWGIMTVIPACGRSGEAALSSLAESGWAFSPEGFVAAAAAGDGDAVSDFLVAGMGVDVVGADGQTSLYRAAAEGHRDVVSALLEAGADPAAPAAEGILVAAVASGDESLVALLLSEGRASYEQGALRVAASGGNLDIVRQLVRGSQPEWPEALATAALRGDTAVVHVLLQAGADPVQGRTMIDAARVGQSESVQVLWDRVAMGAPEVADRVLEEAAEAAEVGGYDELASWLVSQRL